MPYDAEKEKAFREAERRYEREWKIRFFLIYTPIALLFFLGLLWLVLNYAPGLQ